MSNCQALVRLNITKADETCGSWTTLSYIICYYLLSIADSSFVKSEKMYTDGRILQGRQGTAQTNVVNPWIFEVG